MTEALLDIRGLTRTFGGLVANRDIDLAVGIGEIHALIGPNGAGKTTLISQIAGQIAPTSGSIRFAGHDITALPAHKRAAIGLARSFQVTSIFPSFSVFENIALAAQARCGHSFRFWMPASKVREINERSWRVIHDLGLADKAGIRAAELSHGDHRQLEIAMALAGEPKLLLMDEPTAGMGPTESQQLVNLLRRIHENYTILLVEHDMDVVFSIADRITVLDDGRSVVTGTPAEIRMNERVRAAYLGNAAGAGFAGHA